MNICQSGIFFLLGILVLFPVAAEDKANPPEVELVHWWKSGGELAALAEIRKAVEARDVKFVDTAIDNYDLLRARIIERLAEGYPPAMTQWLAGNDLLQLSSIGGVQRVPALWRNEKLEDILFPEVLSEVSQNGTAYSIPVGIHIQNMAFYNAEIYRKLSLKVPDTWQEFLEQAEKIKQAGYTAISLSDEPWQLRFIFNAILMEQLGVQGFQDFYDETKPVRQWQAALYKSIEIFLKLFPYSDPGQKGRLWSDATKQLIDGKAAMQIMGDFAKGEMLFSGKTAGKDFLCALAPGANDTMVYAIDGFVLLKATQPFLKQGQDLLFDVVLDPEVQAAFNSKKGGIPVRYGVDISALDSCAKQQYEAWTSAKKSNIRLPDTSSRLRLSFVQTVLHEAWTSSVHDPDIVTDSLITVIDDALRKSLGN